MLFRAKKPLVHFIAPATGGISALRPGLLSVVPFAQGLKNLETMVVTVAHMVYFFGRPFTA